MPRQRDPSRLVQWSWVGRPRVKKRVQRGVSDASALHAQRRRDGLVANVEHAEAQEYGAGGGSGRRCRREGFGFREGSRLQTGLSRLAEDGEKEFGTVLHAHGVHVEGVTPERRRGHMREELTSTGDAGEVRAVCMGGIYGGCRQPAPVVTPVARLRVHRHVRAGGGSASDEALKQDGCEGPRVVDGREDPGNVERPMHRPVQERVQHARPGSVQAIPKLGVDERQGSPEVFLHTDYWCVCVCVGGVCVCVWYCT